MLMIVFNANEAHFHRKGVFPYPRFKSESFGTRKWLIFVKVPGFLLFKLNNVYSSTRVETRIE